MARKRSISTSMAVDSRLNRLARDYGDFAALAYTWMIPHADDHGILRGEVEELMATVLPLRRDKSPDDLRYALDGMVELDLIAWDEDEGVIAFPLAAWNAHQSYIKTENRRTAEITGKQRRTPENTVSIPSPVPSSLPLPDPPPAVVAPADAAPAQRRPRTVKPALVPLTADERSKLETEFEDIPDVSGAIDLALAHESALKYPTGQYLYVRNWLKRDRGSPAPMQLRPKFGERSNGHGPGKPDPYSLANFRE